LKETEAGNGAATEGDEDVSGSIILLSDIEESEETEVE